MSRLLLAAILVLVASAAPAADLPLGKWSVNVTSTKGELIISEIDKDGKVKGELLGKQVTGMWKNDVLKLHDGLTVLEGRVVTDPAKGRMRYTLTGVRTAPAYLQTDMTDGQIKTGWYAQIIAETPPPQGAIKVEIKGVLVCPPDKPLLEAHVSVKQKNKFGEIEETRIYFWLSEGEWKGRRDDFFRLTGESVSVTGEIAQLPKGTSTSIPECALYFRGFEIKTAKETIK